MTKTRAALLTEFNAPLSVETVELAAVHDRDVRVRLDMAAICYSDILVQQGFSFNSFPMLIGHSGTGIVEEVGSRVTRVSVGDRVVVACTTECGECLYCTQQAPGACERVFRPEGERVLGVTSDGRDVVADGGIGIYAQRSIYDEGTVVSIDVDVPLEHACMLGCGIVSGYAAVTSLARIPAGASVSVSGAGQFGLWIVQAARLAGARRIIAVEPIESRRELAFRMGASDVVDPAVEDPVERVRSLTGGHGVDFAFEAAGPPEAMQQSYSMARFGGTVIPTGLSTIGATVTLDAIEYAVSSRRILSSQTGGGFIHRDIPRFARMLAAGQIDPTPFGAQTYALEDINVALDRMRAREIVSAVVDLR